MALSLHEQSAVQLARALAQRELTAVRLADELIDRSRAWQPQLQAWAQLDAPAVRARARAADAGPGSGRLFGLPLGVKDNIDTAGLRTEYGSPIYAGHVPHADAACVALARAAGAWVLGKTAATEFANMAPCATRNPHCLGRHQDHTPGGSSSGSAAAVAAGLVPLALGTQTAGSVIRPAAYCGVVGFKPSARRVPRAGVKLNSDTLDEVGVFARSVDDAALLAHALQGGGVEALPSAQAFAPKMGLVLVEHAAAAPAMRAMLQAVAARLSRAGAGLLDAQWPVQFNALFEAQRLIQAFETARALAPEWQYRRAGLSAALSSFLAEAAGIPTAEYAAALAQGEQARGQLDALFNRADVLLAPAATGAAPLGLASTGDPLFSRPWQLLGCPCLTLPGGVDAAGLPLGLQLVARPGDDERLFAAAAWAQAQLSPAPRPAFRP